MATEETIAIYQRMEQVLDAVGTNTVALTSRADGLEAASTEMTKNISTLFDLIEGHAANTAMLLSEMKTMQQTLALIRQDLLGHGGSSPL